MPLTEDFWTDPIDSTDLPDPANLHTAWSDWLGHVNPYVSLHTEDPGPTGGKPQNEVSYKGYCQALLCDGWDVSADGTFSNSSVIGFPRIEEEGFSVKVSHIALQSKGRIILAWGIPEPIVLHPDFEIQIPPFGISFTVQDLALAVAVTHLSSSGVLPLA